MNDLGDFDGVSANSTTSADFSETAIITKGNKLAAQAHSEQADWRFVSDPGFYNLLPRA